MLKLLRTVPFIFVLRNGKKMEHFTYTRAKVRAYASVCTCVIRMRMHVRTHAYARRAYCAYAHARYARAYAHESRAYARAYACIRTRYFPYEPRMWPNHHRGVQPLRFFYPLLEFEPLGKLRIRSCLSMWPNDQRGII